MLADDAAGRTPRGLTGPDSSVAQDLLWSVIGCPSPEIVRMALERIDWQRRRFALARDPRKCALSAAPKRSRGATWSAFVWRWIAPTRTSRANGARRCCTTSRASRGGLTDAADRVALRRSCSTRERVWTMRDGLLKNTPLGWACRWGRIELVRLFMDRGGTCCRSRVPNRGPRREPGRKR